MRILNIAGYQFIHLNDLNNLQQALLYQCRHLQLKGTILLSHEGINLSLAGESENVHALKAYLHEKMPSVTFAFHETYSSEQSFDRLKVKIKNEIITMRHHVNVLTANAPYLAPSVLKQWLDEKRKFTLLDTRNDYEIAWGTFSNAMNLQLAHFNEFSTAIHTIPPDQTIVTFCTGGIRCEKAALFLLQQGYTQVYQLAGGILAYFAQVGGTHYDGHCFVFDKRVALDSCLNPVGNMG